jgi:hypothetical protein
MPSTPARQAVTVTLLGTEPGFGRDFDLNTGHWTLELVTTSVTEQTMTEYSRPVDGD